MMITLLAAVVRGQSRLISMLSKINALSSLVHTLCETENIFFKKSCFLLPASLLLKWLRTRCLRLVAFPTYTIFPF